MKHTLTCPHCQGQITVDQTDFGRRLACPHCQNYFFANIDANPTPVRPTQNEPQGQPYGSARAVASALEIIGGFTVACAVAGPIIASVATELPGLLLFELGLSGFISGLLLLGFGFVVSILADIAAKPPH